MRLRDELNSKQERKKKKPKSRKLNEAIKLRETKLKKLEKKSLPEKSEKKSVQKEKEGPIITELDLKLSFERWNTGCNCKEDLLLRKEKPGGNWHFYKVCPACNRRSSTFFTTKQGVEEFLETYIGKFWKDIS